MKKEILIRNTVQGPATEKILQQFVKEDLSKLEFMTQRLVNINGIPCIITRCGYTGILAFYSHLTLCIFLICV